jgi:endonuclease G, mitochondrial
MSALDTLARLRRFNQEVRDRDPDLAEESLETAREEVSEVVAPGAAPQAQGDLESIVMRKQRPVLAIRNNDAVLDFRDLGDSTIWKTRLETAKPFLHDAIRAVGRIDLTGSAGDFIGTGWLVHDSVLVTNRHVARRFAMRDGDRFVFSVGDAGPIGASVDFLQEIDNATKLVFTLVRPLFIQEAPGPDVAFFEIEVESGNESLAKPIALADRATTTKNVAVIGYPAYDSRVPDVALMERIYGSTYNKKRLAPGGVTRVEASRILHDCTTLGGNSGSVVIDLDSGKALGLHFSGAFLTTNYAVRGDVVAELLVDVRSGRVRPEARRGRATPASASTVVLAGVPVTRSASLTIPLTVTVSIGDLRAAPPAPAMTAPIDDGSDAIEGDEGVAADYSDRQGYQPDFLGQRMAVPLPSVEANARDVLTYDNGGVADTVLRYEHYSVVMSKSRRMCFFSAVNIDGNVSKRGARVGWKWDPRIPKEQQIMNECYGKPPKFSRGHMTRREDPGWGDARTARRGNEDSMHVTNTTPQMQAFNAPIWLALEDYALQHAREDDMKISVFTGPYFARNDPMMYGVTIPRLFWKIIVFIHDETKKLCATGYEMSQKKSLLPEEEFVFGAFQSPQLNIATQVPIASIERRSGLSFGDLAAIDPLAGEDEAVGGAQPLALQTVEEICFVR